MDDKYYPIRLEKAVPYFEEIIAELVNRRNEYGQFRKPKEVIRKYFKIPQNTIGEKVTEHRLDSFLSYIEFRDCGRNIFDFSAQLVEMLQHTDVTGIKFSDIKLPYNSFYISYLELELPFQDKYLLDGAYIKLRNYEDDPNAKYTIWIEFCGYDKESVLNKTEFGIQSIDPIYLSSSLTCVHDESTIEDALNYERGIMRELDEREIDIALEEYKLLLDHLKLVVNSLLYLSIPNPDLTDIFGNPTKLQVEKNDVKTENKSHVTTLNDNRLRHLKLVGHKITKRVDAKTSKKVRKHWRRGHWRNQKYRAIGKEERKLIWIQPTIVGDEGEPISGRVYDT